MGKVTGLHHLCVFTTDLDESVRFYCDNLGFQETYRTVEGKDDEPNDWSPLGYSMIRNGRCVIELLCPNNTDTVPVNRRGIIDHIGLAVEGIESLAAELESKGIKLQGPVAENTTLMDGFKAAVLFGPSGEQISLYEFN